MGEGITVINIEKDFIEIVLVGLPYKDDIYYSKHTHNHCLIKRPCIVSLYICSVTIYHSRNRCYSSCFYHEHEQFKTETESKGNRFGGTVM